MFFVFNSYLIKPGNIYLSLVILAAEPAHVLDSPASDTLEEADQNVDKYYDESDHEKLLGNQKEPVAEPPPHSHVQHGNDVSFEVEITSTKIEEDAPKKSYASIVSWQRQRIFISKICY